MESLHPTAAAASTHDIRTDAAILDAVAETAPVAVVATDREARATFWNAAAARIFGLSVDEALGRVPPLLEQLPFVERERILERALSGECVSFVHVERCRKTGRSVRLRATTAPLKARAGEIVGLVAFVTDMETQVRAEAQAAANEQRYRTLFYSAPVGIFETDANGNCVRVNDRWLELAGITREDAYGAGWQRVIHPDDRESVEAAWNAAGATGREFSLEYRYQSPSGSVVWLAGRAVALRDGDGALIGHIGSVEDITARKHAEGRLEHLAAHDALTGIANRATLLSRLETAIADADETGSSLAVLFLDLDGFKDVNDRFGHDAGDALLRKTADRLRGNARAADLVARYGGDEFVVLLPGLEHGRVRAAAEIVIGRLSETLPAPASIGFSVYPDDGRAAADLIAAADAHMYDSKRAALR